MNLKTVTAFLFPDPGHRQVEHGLRGGVPRHRHGQGGHPRENGRPHGQRNLEHSS